ncbi:conserved hypothetical protein [Ricinus communis]|uniref:Uncharacterized protein n=1 Tax=Ricinus communis TaxID=3988 RepID=B9RJ50_RICCO|nr:conserved hypothetical protein [Ricinus communis]
MVFLSPADCSSKYWLQVKKNSLSNSKAPGFNHSCIITMKDLFCLAAEHRTIILSGHNIPSTILAGLVKIKFETHEQEGLSSVPGKMNC